MKIKITSGRLSEFIGKKVYVNWLIPNDDWILLSVFNNKAQIQNKHGEKKVVNVSDVFREI